jgi:hypothetical protein
MSFKKPFRAPPVKVSERYNQKLADEQAQRAARKPQVIAGWLAIAALAVALWWFSVAV